MPIGPVGKPTELHLLYPDPGDDLHQISAGLQGADRVHAGGGQFNHGSKRAVGYLTHCLNAYDANPVWTADPKRTVYPRRRQAHADGRRAWLGRREGGGGDRRLRLLDMFASYCTGREDAKGAMRIAERQLQRIYR